MQARAVEMLSFLGTPESTWETLRVVMSHPSSVVRVAAIDAHLFNNGDADEAKNELREIVDSDDLPYVDMTRWGRASRPVLYPG